MWSVLDPCILPISSVVGGFDNNCHSYLYVVEDGNTKAESITSSLGNSMICYKIKSIQKLDQLFSNVISLSKSKIYFGIH